MSRRLAGGQDLFAENVGVPAMLGQFAHQVKVDPAQGERAVVTAQMGEHPRQELEHLGIEPYVIAGPIKATLLDLARIL